MKNRTMGIIAWGLGLTLINVLSFVLENGLTSTFWTTNLFVWIAFVSTLLLQAIIWRKVKDQTNMFLKIPAITISYIYIALQLPVSVVFSIGSSIISVKISIITNLFIFIGAWGIILGSFIGNNHIRKVDSRQKDHHKEL